MPKRIGRPVKPAKPGERVALSLRVTARMKNRLEVEAVKAGRSLSQEAEMRLEQSFASVESIEIAKEIMRILDERDRSPIIPPRGKPRAR